MSKKWALSRRTFLRGAGAAIALPMLDAMVPRLASAAGAAQPCRLINVVFPHGTPIGTSTGSGSGVDYALSDLFAALAPHKADMLNLGNLGRIQQNLPGDHPRGFGQIFTHQIINSGNEIINGDSYDQLAADHLRQFTPNLPSLELAMEPQNHLGGSDGGVPTYYGNFLSWNGSTPRPATYDVGQAFDRVFANFDPSLSEAERLARKRRDQSILDYTTGQTSELDKRLGSNDRAKLDEYLTAVRDLETRINSGAGQIVCESGTRPDSSSNYPERLDQMLDLMVLAIKCDATRVITLNLGDVYSGLTMSWAPGVPTNGYHTVSHDSPEGLGNGVRYWAQKYGDLLNRMKAEVAPGGNTLLDDSLVLLTSEIKHGPTHRTDNLPCFLAGRAGGAVNTGRRLVAPENTPIASLYVSILNILGVPITSFGANGDGPLAGLA